MKTRPSEQPKRYYKVIGRGINGYVRCDEHEAWESFYETCLLKNHIYDFNHDHWERQCMRNLHNAFMVRSINQKFLESYTWQQHERGFDV